MKYKMFRMCLPLLAGSVLFGCDDQNDIPYTPGQPAPEGCMTVYFDNTNSSELIIEPGEDVSFDITLSREEVAEAAEVPLLCTAKSEGLTVPAKAVFAQGERQTTVSVTFGELEVSKPYSFTLKVDEAYVDHYAMVGGSSLFEGTVMAASWAVYADNVTMEWTTLGVQNTWTTRLERLGNTSRYRFPDFLGSGLPLVFTVSGRSSYYASGNYERIFAFANCEPYVDDAVEGFCFYDDEAGDYPQWTVADGAVGVAELCIMHEYIGDCDYSFVSFDKRDGMLGTYYTTYADGQYDYYNYITFSWPAQ